MKKIGFIGFGKIGRALYDEIQDKNLGEVVFVQDIAQNNIPEGIKYLSAYDKESYEAVDLIIECATASVLSENLERILSTADLLLFSATAFSDAEFEKRAFALAKEYGTHIYLPHGAILGLDGILDGSKVWTEVDIVTTKSPKSLGRTEEELTVLYDGPTRGACKAYPRNVNVHAVVALLGVGFDNTHSKIIADPAVTTNAHVITLKGPGIEIELHVTSKADGGVTGVYTPLSAKGSVSRILGDETLRIV